MNSLYNRETVDFTNSVLTEFSLVLSLHGNHKTHEMLFFFYRHSVWIYFGDLEFKGYMHQWFNAVNVYSLKTISQYYAMEKGRSGVCVERGGGGVLKKL